MIVLNVIVWGLGPHAINNILPAINENENLNLYGILSRDISVVSQIAKEYNCIPFSNENEMLSDTNIQIVYLATPTGLHYRQGIKIIESNKHFWSEKPIVQNSDQAYSLINMANSRKLTIAEGFMYLYHPAFDFLKDTLKTNQLGNLSNITIDFGLPQLSRPGFRNDINLGGGAIYDLGSYAISAVVGLFENENIEIKYCELNYDIKANIDSSAFVLLKINESINVTLRWSYDVSYKNEINVWGDEGCLLNKRFFSKPSDYSPEFVFSNVNGNKRIENIEPANQFYNMFNVFYDNIYDDSQAKKHQEIVIKRAKLLERILVKNVSRLEEL
ncbi:MAG: Gfo/Idh/MocA family oxidoreductase [Lutibacter sp.]|nr:Gfo/Idh/MocA family oxidoreductase [Lutibacter sp.]